VRKTVSVATENNDSDHTATWAKTSYPNRNCIFIKSVAIKKACTLHKHWYAVL